MSAEPKDITNKKRLIKPMFFGALVVVGVILGGVLVTRLSGNSSNTVEQIKQISTEEEAKLVDEVMTYLQQKDTTDKTGCIASETNMLSPSIEATKKRIVIDNDGDRANALYCANMLFLAKNSAGWQIIATTKGVIASSVVDACGLENLVSKVNEVVTQGVVDDAAFTDQEADMYTEQVTNVIARCSEI